MATPPLPPGFVLEPAAAAPPPPPGFVVEEIPTLPTVKAVAPDGWDYGPLRDAMFGARSVLQGAGGLIGALGGDAFNNYVVNPVARAVGLQEARPYRDEAGALADTLRLPKAQTAGDRVLGDVGEALTGTGLTLGAGGALTAGRSVAPTLARAAPAPQVMPALGERAGQFLGSQPGLQTVSAVTGSAAASATKEAGAGPGAQLGAALLGGLGPGIAAGGGAAAVRGIARGRSGARMQQTINDFEALGTTPTVGQATGNTSIQGVENLLAGGPTSAGVMRRFAEGQGQDIAKNLGDRARSMTPDPTRQNAGLAIESGVGSFKKDVSAKRKELYDAVDRVVAPDTAVKLDKTKEILARLTSVDPQAPSSSASMIPDEVSELAKNIGKDLGDAGEALPYSTLKDLRSNLGAGLFDFTLTPDKGTAQLRDVYRAMGDDIEAAVTAAGGEAPAALRRANTYYKQTQEQLKQLERVVNKAGGPEKVYNAVMAGSAEGGTTIKRVMDALPEDGKKALTAAVINRMGRPTPGQAGLPAEQFSPGTFMTNWNRLSEEARRELFDQYGPGFSKDMAQIAKVADNIKSGSEALANPSGSANKAAAYTYGAALVASLMDVTGASTSSLLAGGLGANGGARLLTNPRFVKWLARATTAPIGSVAGSLASLRNIANNTGDEELKDIAEQLRQADQEAANPNDDQ